MPHAPRNFSPISPGERRLYSFDFDPPTLPVNQSPFATGEIIVDGLGTTVTIALESGTDATPGSRLIGARTISGRIMSQMIGDCVDGAVYEVKWKMTSSLGQVMEWCVLLPCEAC